MLNHATWRPTAELAHQHTIEPAEGASPRTSRPSIAAGAPQCSPIRVLADLVQAWRTRAVFYIVTGEPFKQSTELTGEPIKMKG